MALYNEEREGQRPKVTSAGGGNLVVDWEQEPNALSRSSQVLGTILSTLDQEDEKKRKKQAEKFDFYRVLREAGYDPKSAFEAMQSGAPPATPPGETTKEKKEKADLEKSQADVKKTQAETDLAKSKAAAYDRGDIGKRQAAAEKMNAAQLQREIKRMSDPLENPDYDSEDTQSYISFLNQRLQQLARYEGGATTEKVLMKRPDGATVKINAKDVPAAEKKGYKRVNA